MKLSLLFAVVASMLFGCASRSERYAVYVDPAFEPARSSLVLKAIASWSEMVKRFGGGELILDAHVARGDCFGAGRSTTKGDWHSICVTQTTLATLKSDDFGNGIQLLGDTKFSKSVDSSTVYVASDANWAPDVFLGAVSHEIGHAIGLQHTPDWLGESNPHSRDKDTLMRLKAGGDISEPTCMDVVQYDEIRGIAPPDCEKLSAIEATVSPAGGASAAMPLPSIPTEGLQGHGSRILSVPQGANAVLVAAADLLDATPPRIVVSLEDASSAPLFLFVPGDDATQLPTGTTQVRITNLDKRQVAVSVEWYH